MTVISLRRRTRVSELNRARIETLTSVRQKDLDEKVAQATAASKRTEAAAARLLEGHEQLLRGA